MNETDTGKHETDLKSGMFYMERRTLWIALALVGFISLPFLNKPFTIDDPVVLSVSEQILKDPFRPLAGTINWFDDPAPMFQITTNPPFVSYWLALFLAVFGYNEPALHASFIPFLLLLAFSTAVLSRRFCRGNLFPLLLVMTSPAVVVSPNLMRDMPGAALLTGAVAFYISGCDTDSRLKLFIGALLAGLAGLTKYPLLAGVVILGLYALLNRKPRALLWLFIPVLLVAAWFLQNWLFQGESHLGFLARERKTSFTAINKLYGAIVIVGSCLFLAPAFLIRELLRLRRMLFLTLIALVSLILVYYYLHSYRNVFTLQIALWTASGAIVLGWLLLETFTGRNNHLPVDLYVRPRDTAFLAVWAFLPIVISIFFIFFQAVRHILPAVPPLVLLSIHLLSRTRWLYSGLLKWALFCSVFFQAVVSLLVGVADYDFANAQREFSRYVQERYEKAGETVWFRGNWGWQMYERIAQHPQIAAHGDLPPPGALVVWPDDVHYGPLPEGLEPRLERLETYEYRQRLPLHTMTGGACFYAVTRRMLPYWFGRKQVWRAGVYRVKSLDNQYPPP